LPLIFSYVKTFNGSLLFFLASIVISLLAKFLVFRYLTGVYPQLTLVEYTYYWLPAQLPVFALGVTLYFGLFKTDFEAGIPPQFKTYLSYFLIFTGGYFFVVTSFSTRFFITENIAFSFALMLLILGMAINPLSVFNNRFMQFLGKISYSFYLLHFVIIAIARHYVLPAIIFKGNVLFFGAFVFVLFITSAVSYISYKVIEQPFQKLGVRLINKWENGR